MIHRSPPRLARWLVDRVLAGDARGDAMRGDLLEEFRERPGSGIGASLWYWRHALSVAVRYSGTHHGHITQARGGMVFDSIWQDVRYAVRSHIKAPSFTLALVATLALGIGASTAIFSMLNGIVLRPLPYPQPDRLVFANEVNGHGNPMSVSWLNFVDWRTRAHAFESLAASRPDLFTLTGTGRAERLDGRHVTANFLHVLRVSPLLGRDFEDTDDRPGAAPVAIVSHEFWRRALGGTPQAIGTTLRLDDHPYLVVGVLPPGFKYVRRYDLFVPMGPIAGLGYIHDRGDHAGYFAVGRLKPGMTVEAATDDLQAIASDLRREHPDTNADVSVLVEPLLSRVVSDVRLTLFVLFGAVGFLLLMACVNVANLLIARGAARRHELAVRAALGGGRLRIVRQLLVESTLLSAAGGVLGVALATALLRILIATAPEGTPRLDEVGVDRAALVFAIGAAGLCGVVFGLFPAFHASSVVGQEVVIRGRASGASAASHRVRRALMAAEVALAVVLLTGAGLMVRTLADLTRVDTGFRSDRLLTLRTALHGERWSHTRRILFLDGLLARIRQLPGAVDAAVVSALPIDGSDWNSIFIVSDKPVPPRTELPAAAFTIVSPRYFETMGTPLLTGRAFADEDSSGSAKVIVVNEALARRVWPGESPIGKRLKQGWPESQSPWREVVGVVADVKFEGLAEVTPLQVYMPAAQEPTSDYAIVVRSNAPPPALEAPVEAAVRALDPDVPVFTVRTMDRVIAASVGRERMSVVVLGLFAFVALTLASIGLYGLVAHGVTERTHEIGVRMALGAHRRHVVSLVIRQGLTMAIAGAAVGVVGALALSRSIRGLLFGVTPTDPLTFMTVIGMLLCVATLACYIPASRATRLDPMRALRSE
jgi:predicted permease